MSSAEQAVTLVTGSARGLGLEVARHLARRGDSVHVVWRSAGERAQALRAEFGACTHQADLTQAADVERVVHEVTAAEGRLDHVVHAVGEYVSGPVAGTTQADLQRMFTSNVVTSFLLVNAARTALRASRGDVVLFGCSGLEGHRARKITAAYASAKSALRVLMRAWATEEAPHGVRVNMVSPGHVPHDDAHPDTLEHERLAKIPLGRPGTPDDIARSVAYLASDEAAYVTGTDLFVSGGWML